MIEKSTGFLKKIKRVVYVFYFSLIIITINIMKIVNLPSTEIDFNIALSDIVFPILFILLLISLRNQKFKNTFTGYPWMIALVLWITLTNYLAIHSESILDAGYQGYVSEIIKTINCIGYFFIGYNVLKYINKELFFRLWAIGSSIFLGVGFTFYYLAAHGITTDLIDYKYGIYFLGTYTDPNHAATYLTLTIFLMVLGIYIDQSKIAKCIYSVVSILSFIALLLTDSRGGLICFVAAVGVFIVLSIRKKQLLVTSILFIIFITLFALNVDQLVSESRYIGKLANSILDFKRGFEIRFNLAEAARLMGNDHWLFGVGRGNYVLNSPRYFEQMGAEFIDNIPHNTYLGLYAEVGIIGLLLYFSPVLLVIKGLWKKKKVSKDWFHNNRFFISIILAIVVGVGIQAAVLNVENRRTLWLIGGVLLYWIRNVQMNTTHEENQSSIVKNIRKINWLLGIIVIATLLYSSVTVSFDKKRIEVTDDYRIELPFLEEQVGQSLVVEYTIDTRQKDLTGNVVKMSIVEVLPSGIEYTLDWYTYPQAVGTAQREFVKTEKDSKVYLQFDKLSDELEKYNLLPTRVLTDKQVYHLDRNYYLLPDSLEDKMASFLWKEYKGEDFEQRIDQALDINFDDKISLDKFEMYKDNENRFIELTFTALEDIDVDYVLWMYGIPNNIHHLNPSRLRANNEYYTPIEPVETSKWTKGESYTVAYQFPRNYGWYHLRTGFYVKANEEVVRLYDVETNRYYADLGWVNMNEN